MIKYVIDKCKRYIWILLLVVFLSALSTVASQYIYKFIGFVIDYGLNYNGSSYNGEFSFLFNGKFGNYGSLNLIITLAICMIICALISYVSSYMTSYVQMRGQHTIINKYRIEI